MSMIRALVLRTRLMPSTIHLSIRPGLPAWKDPRNLRWESTAQESRGHHGDDAAAAMMHGNTKKGGRSTGSQKPGNVALHKGPQDDKVDALPPQQSAQRKPPTKKQTRANKFKRQAGEKSEQRPSKKQARPVLQDEAYIRRNFHVPTPQDYPNFPQTFFKDFKHSVNNVTSGLAAIRTVYKSLGKQGPYSCTLFLESSTRHEVVVGEGMTQRAASDAAYLRLAANLHDQGIFAEVLDRKSGSNKSIIASIKREREDDKDAIMDMYNYAARYDEVPIITSQVVHMKQRGRMRKYTEVTVELLGQGIKVKGLGPTSADADINAGKAFKEEAERYHAQRGSEAIIIKDSGALTTENATQFLEFYKILRPGIRIDLCSSPPDSHDGQKIQVKINDELIGTAVEMHNKKRAERTASLTASIALKKKQPQIFPQFLRALKDGNGQILRPVAPLDFIVDEDCSLVMREVLLGARKAGLPDEVEDYVPVEERSESNSRGYWHQPLRADEMERRNWSLKQKLSLFMQNEMHEGLRTRKAELPMNQYGAQVLDLVNDNVYSIIVGATGSGKTTQVPQILFEDAIAKGQGGACNIICTQPRRIAATSVASRVAEERGEALQATVGYQVRHNSKLPRYGGSILYCTTGILLRQLQTVPDELMESTSHLVIDEVHERDMQIDFLLILLKKTIMRRKAQGAKNPRIILMSATLDTELFATYFESEIPGQGTVKCPTLNVPGRMFPVKERYLGDILKEMSDSSPSSQLQAMHLDPHSRDYLEVEDKYRAENPTGLHHSSNTSKDQESVIDWKGEHKVSADASGVSIAAEKANMLVPHGLVACTIAHIVKTSEEGSILVFLPGLGEITRVDDVLKQYDFGVAFGDFSKFRIILLHSSITNQNTVFDPVPAGCRKIILATNIAETSVTIPDVQYVVDTGKLRERQYDQQRRISQLVCTWISKSNAKQRAGRAGRVQNGNYYALYTKERYESLPAIGLPELLRIDLQGICLEIKAQAFNVPIRDFLAEAIEPPSATAVDASVINLKNLDALTDEEQITPLGRLLASLPIHPSLGKMIVLGIIFRCLDPMLIIGAAAADRSLFVRPLEARSEAHEAKLSFVEGSGSDHIALLNAVRGLRRARDEGKSHSLHEFAMRNFLHIGAFKSIETVAAQIFSLLSDAGLVPPSRIRGKSEIGDPALNQNSHKVPLIKALLLSGTHPNLAVMPGGRMFRTRGERSTMIHPSSVNAIHDYYRTGQGEGHHNKETSYKLGSLYSYSNMSRSNDGNNLHLCETTESTPLIATLFGGKLKRNEERGNILEVDNWLPFYVSSPDRRTAKTIMEFRKALERLLAIAFRDLGQMSARTYGQDSRVFEQRQFLADEKVRELFAEGLVQVLDRDVRSDELTALRGWGAKDTQGSWKEEMKHMGANRGSERGSRNGGAGNGRRAGRPAFYEDLMKF